MTPDRWQQVKGLFDRAVACEPTERDSFLREICAGDTDLYRELASLLASYETTGSFFDKPLINPEALVDPMIGRAFGVYQIVREIGRGGMGSVYLATRTDDQFRRRVAVKAIRPDLADPHTLRRFHNERQTLAVLDHPNIIKLLDGGQSDDGMPYLVMDYVEGQPIDEYCDSHKLTIPERLKLFRGVCAAVHYAHQNLVVHRDLKPSNILITPDGVPKLLDFGIAKLLRPEYSAAAMGITRTRLQPMTPKYASPEQVLGQPITTASDIYALGVILYELLTGQHPFEREGASELALQRAIADLDPQKPSLAVTHAGDRTEAVLQRFRETRSQSLAHRLSGDLDAIVLMAMRKEPQRRYASAEHLSEDVRRHQVGLPVIARKGTAQYRLTKFVRRHKMGVAAGLLVTLSLITSTVVAQRARRHAERMFEDLRQFDNSIVGDLDLQARLGATPERRAVLAKAVESLDRLAREAKDDPSVQRDLITAYIKMGNVQGNPYVANLGNKKAAEENYRKALAMAEALWKAHPGETGNRQAVAHTYLRLGDLLTDPKAALEQHRKALAIYQALPTADRDVQNGVMNAWTKIALTQQQLGDDAGALESCRRGLEFAHDHQRTGGSVALLEERFAYFSALRGETDGAEEKVRDAIRYYQQAEQPRNVEQGFRTLADVQKRMGRTAAALESVGKSLEITDKLLRGDPKNKLYQIDYQQGLILRIELLAADGQKTQQREETVHALKFVKPLLDLPDTSEYQLNDHVRLLVTTPFPDLQDRAAALRYARQLVAMTHSADPEALDLLATACDQSGDPAGAIEAERKAIALVPASAAGAKPSELRKTLEEHLAAQESHAAPKH